MEQGQPEQEVGLTPQITLTEGHKYIDLLNIVRPQV
jgi:hypothetical protein